MSEVKKEEIEEPKIYNIEKDLVYSEGSVISKTILKREIGNVTLFSFDKGQGLSEHTAPFDALVTVLDGECEFKLCGNTYNLKAGNIIIMPANIPHALFARSEKFKMMLVMIKAS